MKKSIIILIILLILTGCGKTESNVKEKNNIEINYSDNIVDGFKILEVNYNDKDNSLNVKINSIDDNCKYDNLKLIILYNKEQSDTFPVFLLDENMPKCNQQPITMSLEISKEKINNIDLITLVNVE